MESTTKRGLRLIRDSAEFTAQRPAAPAAAILRLQNGIDRLAPAPAFGAGRVLPGAVYTFTGIFVCDKILRNNF